MLKGSVLLLLGIGLCGICPAAVIATPEIDPGTAVNALAILAGTVLMVRGRRRK